MRFVALLRGINVGGNSRVEMAKLRETFARLGFEGVRTYINSGNVIFDTTRKSEARLVKDIERAVEDDFGLSVPVVIRSRERLEETAAALPETWVNDKSVKTDVLFLWDDVDSPTVLEELDPREGIDNLDYVPGAVLWHIDRRDATKSALNKLVGSRLYKRITIRNANTVRKLAMLVGEKP